MYDTLIIGAGPAGMTAALYAARSNLKVALLEAGIPGGQMNNTSDIENYPGYANISGPELAEKMFEPLEALGVEHLFGRAENIVDQGSYKEITTDDGLLQAKTVIIATGSNHRLLGVPGEEELNSRGVSYCAVCDGAFFRDEDLMVVGGGDSAVEEAIFLTQFAKSVTIVHPRDALRAQKVLQDRAFSNNKIDFTWNTNVVEIVGHDNRVTGIKMVDNQSGKLTTVDTTGVFIYIGNIPNTQMFSNLNITDESGWIITNSEMETNIPGIFAIGDVRLKKLRQITTAVGDGGIAGQNSFEYIEQFNEK